MAEIPTGKYQYIITVLENTPKMGILGYTRKYIFSVLFCWLISANLYNSDDIRLH